MISWKWEGGQHMNPNHVSETMHLHCTACGENMLITITPTCLICSKLCSCLLSESLPREAKGGKPLPERLHDFLTICGMKYSRTEPLREEGPSHGKSREK